MHHQYKQPDCWAVEYAHFLEYALVNAPALFLGPMLLRSHIQTFWVWLVIRLLEGIDGHCGYDFWFSPFRYFPFRPGANVHDYHHSHNVGNYGSFFTFWDSICGTDLSYQDYRMRTLEREQEMEKWTPLTLFKSPSPNNYCGMHLFASVCYFCVLFLCTVYGLTIFWQIWTLTSFAIAHAYCIRSSTN